MSTHLFSKVSKGALVAVSLAVGLAASAAFASPPASTPQPRWSRAIDLDLKDIDVRKVFPILADVSGAKVVLDACVHGKIDLRLKNVPVSLAFDAIASKVGLVYEDNGATRLVHCATQSTPNVPAVLDTRVTVQGTSAPLEDLVAAIARDAHLDGVDYHASAKPRLTVTLQGVRVATALAALSDESGLLVHVVERRIVVD